VRTRAKPPARRGVGRPGDGQDVRGAILDAALHQLLVTASPDRVTVAAIVAEAGCTPPSLYHYWPKRELLLKEASEHGWTQFRASQSGAATDHHDPVERLRLRGKAYLDFSLARPALFRVLFLEPQSVATTHAAPQTTRRTPIRPPDETGPALDDLVADVIAAMATGQLRPSDPLTTALALWAAVHGVAALWAITPSLPNGVAHAGSLPAGVKDS
jgi:AcrR family transcriptional regulator